MKKKLFASSLTLFAVAAVILTLGSLTVAPETNARPPVSCEGSFLTIEQWGHGSTCNEATQDLYNQVYSLAEERCGTGNVCNSALVITVGCPNPWDQSIMADGQLQHGCLNGEASY